MKILMSQRDVDFSRVGIEPVNAIVPRFHASNAQGHISKLEKTQLRKLVQKLFGELSQCLGAKVKFLSSMDKI